MIEEKEAWPENDDERVGVPFQIVEKKPEYVQMDCYCGNGESCSVCSPSLKPHQWELMPVVK
jgi:hypothetical protein